MMTGHPGHLRRRRHGPRRAHRDGRASATASRPRATSTPGSAARATSRAPEHELADFDAAQHLVLRGRAAHRPARSSSWPAAQSTFDEVVGGLDESNALFEARRCLSCGNCFSCDNCYGVCPDNAVIKLGGREEPYAIDYDYCKGCGICAAECPCGAIEMVPEEI